MSVKMLAVKQRLTSWQEKQPRQSMRFTSDGYPAGPREAPLWAKDHAVHGEQVQKRGRRLSIGGNAAMLVRVKTDKNTYEVPREEVNGQAYAVSDFNMGRFEEAVNGAVKSKRRWSVGNIHQVHVYDAPDPVNFSLLPQSQPTSSSSTIGVSEGPGGQVSSNGSVTQSERHHNHRQLPPLVAPRTPRHLHVSRKKRTCAFSVSGVSASKPILVCLAFGSFSS